ncbi:MAG: hypothetical protein ACFFCW_08620 [Candidatus Hodarchaeota archaeon]
MDWFKNNLETLVANAFIAVAAGALFCFGDKHISHIIWGLVALVFFWLGWYQGRKRSKKCDFYDITLGQCKFGIVDFNPKASIADQSTLQEVDKGKSYTWTGATGREPAFHMNTDDSCGPDPKKNRQYSFAIMDPELITLARAHARWENKKEHKETEQELKKNLQDLTKLSRKDPKNFEIHRHPCIPTFRVIVVNDKKAYVSFYERNSSGPKGRQLVIKDNSGDECIFPWFQQYHQRHKEEAQRNRIIRKILKCTRIQLNEETLTKIQKAVEGLAKKEQPEFANLIREAGSELGFLSS